MMRRFTWSRRRIALLAGSAVVLGGALAVGTGMGQAGESCAGLDTALRNNLNFIADQQRNPDALSTARIANRQAVVDLIQQRRATAGCTATVAADNPAAPAPAQPQAPETTPAAPAGNGERVCAGSTVTLSGEAGAPAASSNQFPAGTRLRVTNVDNNRSIVVEVTGPSGSCVLLNNAAFEQVREPGKFLIRRALIERA
ncbi:RlpA-like double-psi beta-barrel domain-containing protein [Phytohabitans aurantiacus]|jgi:hypothetical protein|uniref:23.9 kDa protein in glnII region n=1 Tax=Phytohabitans aurantiacus TaxID=3016789 RepID=A0ABQ5QM91_9ACTN|nr:hypothetical protein [Phytohabitans aurantiacus]GLH95828.1 hypothetical protein Pa4123_11000 [Phytohabitans aurantiacus]